MHSKHYKAVNLKKLVLFVYHFKLLLKTVFYLSCKIWFLHIWDFDFHVYRNLMNRSRYVIYKLWGLLHDLILNCLTMIFLPPNVARINGEAGGGPTTFLQLPQIYAQKFIRLYFLSSKPFTDLKSVEISRLAFDFRNFFFSKNI